MRLQSLTREGCWLQSTSIHPDDENQEDDWSQNPTVHEHSNFFTRTKANSISGHNLLKQTLLNTCATCVLFDSL